MGDLTAHFSSHEFACRDGSTHPIDPKLLAMLEAVRAHFGDPVTITSAYRSIAYNAKVKGASSSYHVRGMAADFKVLGDQTIKEVHAWCDKTWPISGIGLYVRDGGWGWVHIDCRSYRARWTG